MAKAAIVLDTTDPLGTHSVERLEVKPALPGSAFEIRYARFAETVGKYLQLAKPGIVMGNLVSVIGGFMLASRGHIDFALLLATTVGVSLVIASGCVCNNCIDRDIDVKMRRTQNRILVRGKLSARAALTYAGILGALGVYLLAHFANLLSAELVAIGFAIYVGLYSLYMKRNSVFGTFVGSFSGAMPPVIGYCAVSGHFDVAAAVLLATFSLWQMPHSYAIAILHLKDYAAAGIPVLPVKKGIPSTKIHIIFYIVAFTAAALLLGLSGYAGKLYIGVTGALGLYWLWMAISGYKAVDERAWARKMFIFSVLCITALSVMMSIDYQAVPQDRALSLPELLSHL